MLGRLNTVEALSARGRPVPAVRLWATRSLHDLHALVLREVRDLTDAVQRERDYGAALRSRPLWITGRTARGAPISLRMSRPAFSARREAEMRRGGAEDAPITPLRNRGIRLAAPARAAPFPPRSACTCTERLPNALGARSDRDDQDRSPGGGGDGGLEEYQWNPAGEAEWSADTHSLYVVSVPPEMLDEAAAGRFVAGNPALMVPCQRGGRWQFKTLAAARAFIAAGAAGPGEARLFSLMHPPDLAAASAANARSPARSAGGGGRGDLGRQRDPASESLSGSARPVQRRRLFSDETAGPDPSGPGCSDPASAGAAVTAVAAGTSAAAAAGATPAAAGAAAPAAVSP